MEAKTLQHNRIHIEKIRSKGKNVNPLESNRQKTRLVQNSVERCC
jgi:hypothetical protein